MTVRFQQTPNPNAGKFVADQPVVEGKASQSFFNAAQAASNPIAAALFKLPGVASVFMVEDFVTVTKSPSTEWNALVPAVLSTLESLLS